MTALRGWEAIDAAVQMAYGHDQPLHYGTVQRYSEGGPDPLDGISVYRGHSPEHWHYVTFGLTELDGKESERPEVSGWGFELSFRLLRMTDSDPPSWALGFLQRIARHVFDNQSPFRAGDCLDWGGPIAGSEKTGSEALVFYLDPVLKGVSAPNGRVQFLCPIGITRDEYHFAQQTGANELLDHLLADNPIGIVDLQRRSVLAQENGGEPFIVNEGGDR